MSDSRIARECLAAGVAAVIADAIFNPSTVLQIRGQLEPNSSMVSLANRAIASEGVLRGLWLPGLQAICCRGLTYSGFRVGAYPTVRDSLPGDGVSKRVIAGSVTGCLGAFVFAPFEVIRVRQSGLSPYATTLEAAQAMARRGLLWCGAAPFALRCGCFSGVQLASYETSKQYLQTSGVMPDEDARLHLVASCISGICAQVACHPLDTIKTLVMHRSSSSPQSAHSVTALWRELRAGAGGPLALARRLYSGLLPALLSRGPMVMVFLPLVEQVRMCFGVGFI